MALAVQKLMGRKLIPFSPIVDFVAATSVGIVDGASCLDLDYREDSKAEVDMNLVMTGSGNYVELQGTAEKTPFSSEQLQQLQLLGARGIQQLVGIQKTVLEPRVDFKQLFPLLK